MARKVQRHQTCQDIRCSVSREWRSLENVWNQCRAWNCSRIFDCQSSDSWVWFCHQSAADVQCRQVLHMSAVKESVQRGWRWFSVRHSGVCSVCCSVWELLLHLMDQWHHLLKNPVRGLNIDPSRRSEHVSFRKLGGTAVSFLHLRSPPRILQYMIYRSHTRVVFQAMKHDADSKPEQKGEM